MRIYIHILPSQLIEELPSIESSFANPYFEYKHSIYINQKSLKKFSWILHRVSLDVIGLTIYIPIDTFSML